MPDSIPPIKVIVLTEQERDLVLGALDSLGVALTEHNHQWTDGERAIYEEACAVLGQPDISDASD